MKWGLFAVGAIASTLGFAFYVGRSASRAPGSADGDLSARNGSLSSEIESVEDAVFNGRKWYVVDRKGNRIHILDSLGTRVSGFGREGGGPGEFRRPLHIAAADDRVYVSELTIPDVSVFDTTGVFIKRLNSERPCGPSGIVAMNALGSELIVLRQCLEATRVRYQIEHSVGDHLVVWNLLADTAGLSQAGLPLLTFPLFAADSNRVVLSVGAEQCLEVVRRADGVRERSRCLSDIPRVVIPPDERAGLVARFGKRMEVPDSLPRARRILLLDSLLFVQAVDGSESTTWKQVRLADPAAKPIVLGRQGVRSSFLSRDGSVQLTAWDDVEGIRTEVIRVSH